MRSVSQYYNSSSINPFTHQNNKYLVWARVSDKSLHREWLKPSEYRNFDLYLEYYGETPNRFKEDCDFYTQAKDLKWPRLYEVMKQWGESILQYDAIWLPDDDISTDSVTINKMFYYFEWFKLSLAQPALTKNSYYSHDITLRNTDYLLRYTNYVEPMAPIFTRDTLKLCWQTFNKSKSGWALDFIWPKLLGYPEDKIAIIDKTPVTHTRPVGGGTLYKDIGHSPWDDLNKICYEYNVKPFDFKTYGGIKGKSETFDFYSKY